MDLQIFLEIGKNRQSSYAEGSGLRFEEWKRVFSIRDMGVYMFDLQREICKPVLKLDFMAHGKMESL